MATVAAGTAPPVSDAGWFDTPLHRGISPRMLTLFIIGDVIGGGIYALVGVIAGEVGGAMWAPFLLAFLLAMLTAGAYAELISKYPRAGGAAVFVQRAYRSNALAFVAGVAVLCSGLTSAASLATAFGGNYFQELVSAPQLLVSLLFVGVVALVNLRGVTESVRVNLAFTLIEVVGLLLIVGIALSVIFGGSGEADPSRALDFKAGDTVFALVLSGAALAFYAFVGFEDSANMAEEVQDPSRAYPKALLTGLLVAGAIYMLVTITTAMVVSTDTLLGSDGAPLLEVVRVGGGVPLDLFAVIGLFAVANGALINLMMASRLLYGMGRSNLVPAAFSRVHQTRRTPWVAIAFTTVLCGVLIATGTVADLAATTSLLLMLVFTLVNVAVLLLRRESVDHDHFRIPTVIPVAGAAVCLALLTQQEGETWARAGILIGIGVVLWLIQYATGGGRGGDPVAASHPTTDEVHAAS